MNVVLDAGRTLGDFVIRKRIGQGGSGDVYLAEQVTLNREAVVKVIGEADQVIADRFLREVRIASQLDHPFAAHVYGFGGENDGTLWIAMELVRGTSLDQFIKQSGAIPLARFVPFFERVCEVLDAAHEQGIVHRDIKPHNIMVLNRAGRLLPKLLDFGIARRGNDAPISSNTPRPMGGNTPRPMSLDKKDLVGRLVSTETLELTQIGAVVGTPHYMSPEQWENAKTVDKRTDEYSLAMLAYQAIAGDLPFSAANSLWQLGKMHMMEPLPPLPDSLPVALNDVLSRAAAKKPEDRYPSVGEFSRAFREAAGLGDVPLELPELDQSLMATLIADAPQPIAEAAVVVESARNVRTQLDAILKTKRVSARYLGLIALASRARIGGANESVDALLRQLATGDLSDEAWMQIARESAQPFRLKRGAYPLPEFISFFFGESAALGAGEEAWRELQQIAVPDARAQENILQEALQKLVPALGHFLQTLSFLIDYPLVVDGERWMGTRRDQRLVAKVVGEAGEHHPLLLDQNGIVVLDLFPLVQVFSPSGGMDEELFWLDGAGRRGARLTALPRAFERYSEELWAWFSEHVLEVSALQSAQASNEKPPYKGLTTFSSDDADNYFGRERESEAFANRLRRAPFLAVVGPSGTGKSSFILAGVLPLLPKGWRAVVARPGANPFAALQAKLGGEALTPENLGAILLASLGEDESLLLVIDQFEELVTLCLDAEMREAFARALISAAENESGRIRVVITLRDDFLIKAQQLSALRDRLSRSLELIGTPAESDLMRVITEPARRVGFSFDDANLPKKMVQAVAEYSSALALLSFTASQLWELRDRQTRQMRAKTYDALGGVGGALAQHAETTLAQMSDEERPLVREAFRNLVTAQGTRAVLSRKETLDVLGATPAAQSVLEKLIQARLLVASETASGDDQIEIIHEALIISWPRLVEWQREDAEIARLRDSLRASARQWDERSRPRGLLWRAETLAEYKLWRARFSGRLTEVEDAFARASLADEQSTRRIRQVLASVAIVGLVVALVLIFRAYEKAHAQLLAMREEQGRLALIDDKPMEALAYLHAATEGGLDDDAIRKMAGVLDKLLAGSEGVVADARASIRHLARSNDGVWLIALTAEKKMAISDLRTRESRIVSTESKCIRGAFNKENFSVGCDDGILRTIDLRTGNIISKINVSTRRISNVEAHPGHDSVFAVVPGEGLYEAGLEKKLIFAAKNPALDVAASSDGKTVALFAGIESDGRTPFPGVVFLDLSAGTTTAISLNTMVTNAQFSPDGNSIAVAIANGELGLWSIEKRAWLWRKAINSGNSFHLYFSPQGDQLVAAEEGRLTLLTADGAPRWRVEMKDLGPIVSWAPDGQRLAVTGDAPAVTLFDASGGDVLFRFQGHAATSGFSVFSRDGTEIYSSDAKGSIRAWDSSQHYATTIDVPPFLDLETCLGTDRGLIVTRSGVYSIDEQFAPRMVVPLEIAANVLVSSACYGNLAVFNVGRDASLLDSQTGKIKKFTLPTPATASSISSDGSTIGFLDSTGKAFLMSIETGVAQELASNSLVPPLFIGSAAAALCAVDGTLSWWDLHGQRHNAVKTQQSYCSMEPLENGLRTLGLQSATDWKLDNFALTPVRQHSDLPAAFLATDESPTVRGIDSANQWAWLADDGAAVAGIPVRREAIRGALGAKSSIYFVDASGSAGAIDAPHEGLAADIAGLDATRGIFTIDTKGRLQLR